MTWYLVNVVDHQPGDLPWPFPAMKIAARSEAEARQVAELFLVGDVEIESVTELGPVTVGEEAHPAFWRTDAP